MNTITSGNHQTDDTVFPLLESLREAVFLINTEGIILSANSKFAARFDKRPSECIGTSVYDLIAVDLQLPDLADQRRKKIQKILQTGKREIFENEIHNRIWKVTINPVRSSEGEISRLLVITEDISEQKRAEIELEKECRLKTAVLDEMPGCAAVLDAEGQLILWNQYARQLVLGDRENLNKDIGYKKIISADDFFPIKQKFLDILKSGADDSSEVRIQPPGSDKAQWVATRGRRIVINGQQCVVAVGMDINEQKRLEEELKESESKFRSIFENAPVAICIEDTENGRLIDVNASWLQLFGYTKEEAMGKPASALVFHAGISEDEKNASMHSHYNGTINTPLRLRKRSGEPVNVLCSSEVITLEDKPVLLKMMIDITLQEIQQQNIDQLEKTVAERTIQLQEEVERLQRFLSMISHEYRTPLAIIRSNLDLIKMKSKTDDISNKVELFKINRAIDRLVEVMETSIQESRVSQSQKVSSLTRFQIAPVIASQIEAFCSMWMERSVNYSECIGTCEIIGEPSQIKIAIFNLLDNARKYSSTESPIEVDCRIENNDVVIRIRNNCKPVTQKEAETFFEKYHRGSNSVNTAGAGLGLWLARNIINHHNGEVSLEGIASGVEATIRLPIVPQPELTLQPE